MASTGRISPSALLGAVSLSNRKQGRCHARRLLVEAARSGRSARCAVRPAGPLKAFFLRLKGCKGANVTVVAAARRLATII